MNNLKHKNHKNFTHLEKLHKSLKAPTLIVEEILRHFSPKSMIDLGCGLGAFVKIFTDFGIDAYGVNGDWVEKSNLIMDEDRLIIKNLENYCEFKQKYDIAISLEVAEHIDEKYSDNYIKTITSCSDIIVFSAAIPGQIGDGHINEQSPEYWEKKFNKFGYVFYDVFRWRFWNNKDIPIWYKQNMFLVVKDGVELPSSLEEKCPRYIIHPDLFNGYNIHTLPIFSLFRNFLGRIFYTILPICKK